jgi:hypothetical protein
LALVAYAVLFFCCGPLERALDLSAPDRTPAEDIAHLSKFLPPPSWKREAEQATGDSDKLAEEVDEPLDLAPYIMLRV